MERRKQTGSGPQDIVVSSLGFLFVLYSLDLKLKNLEMPTVADNKGPNKSLLSATKGQGKQYPARMENFRLLLSSQILPHSHPGQQGPSGEPRCLSSAGYNQAPQYHCPNNITKEVGSQYVPPNKTIKLSDKTQKKIFTT